MATMTVAAAIAAYNGGTLAAGTTISDSAYNLSNSIDTLQGIVGGNATLITAIALTNADRPALPITVAQLAADAAVLALITTPYGPTQRVTAAAASATTLASGFLSVSVVDTAANVQANIAGIETLYAKNALGPIFLTDGGTPTISLSAAQVAANTAALARIGKYNLVLTDAGTPTLTLPDWAPAASAYSNVVNHITTPFNLAVSGWLRTPNVANILAEASRTDNRSARGSATDPITPLGVLYTGLLPSGIQIFDGPINIGDFFDALQTAAAAGKISKIVGYYSGINGLQLTPATATADASVLSLLSPNFQLQQIITAAQAASPPALDSHFFKYAVFDTPANLIANATAVGALFASGQANYLAMPNTAADFVMNAATFAQLAIAIAFYGDETPVITLTDGGTPTVTLSADVLALGPVRSNVLVYVNGAYHLAVSGPISAALVTTIVNENTVVRSSLTGVVVYDTAANITANIASLNNLVTLGGDQRDPAQPERGRGAGAEPDAADVLCRGAGQDHLALCGGFGDRHAVDDDGGEFPGQYHRL